MTAPVRVTTDTGFYGQHADSAELWSPGSPVLPNVEEIDTLDNVTAADFRTALGR